MICTCFIFPITRNRSNATSSLVYNRPFPLSTFQASTYPDWECDPNATEGPRRIIGNCNDLQGGVKHKHWFVVISETHSPYFLTTRVQKSSQKCTCVSVVDYSLHIKDRRCQVSGDQHCHSWRDFVKDIDYQVFSLLVTFGEWRLWI